LLPVLKKLLFDQFFFSMKNIFTIILFLFFSKIVAQDNTAYATYAAHVRVADSLRLSREPALAAARYSQAFETLGWKGMQMDRYHAAQAWALAGVPDSAFFNLIRIAERMKFDDPIMLAGDPDFTNLRRDPRWAVLLERVRGNETRSQQKKSPNGTAQKSPVVTRNELE
jgi:hypothetical protein